MTIINAGEVRHSDDSDDKFLLLMQQDSRQVAMITYHSMITLALTQCPYLIMLVYVITSAMPRYRFTLSDRNIPSESNFTGVAMTNLLDLD